MLVSRIASARRALSTNALKLLREQTGAPLIDCKNALAATQNDVEKAKQWIAERNKSVAAKISGRSAKQGLIGLALNSSAGALVEINCETDFVARGKDFQDLTRQQAEMVVKGSQIPAEEVTKVAGRVRENIVLGGTLRLTSKPGGVMGFYLHNTVGENVGSTAAIVSLSNLGEIGQDQAKSLARAIAVQIVGAKPPHISKEQVPSDKRKLEEDRILLEAAGALKGKPEKAKESLLRGRMQKFYGDLCLLEQPFLLGEHEGKLVRDVLPKGATIDGFIRMSLGGDTSQVIIS